MLLRRSASDDPWAAERVAGLLRREGGGWMLPPEPGDGAQEHVADGVAADEAPSRAEERVAPDAADDDPRSWVASAVPETLRGGRLDPGAKGVAALLAVALVAAVVTGAVVLRGRPQQIAVPAVEHGGVPLPGVSAEPVPSDEVVVAVAGLVVSPGLVRLPAGSRVDDAVRAAGGLAPGADVGLLNLARKLVDGEQVLVGVEPPPGAPPGGIPAGRGASAAGGLLDLNAASVSDFDALPGIGPVLAQRIVDWRTDNGRFASVDQLREVTGIGESKYRDLEDKVTV